MHGTDIFNTVSSVFPLKGYTQGMHQKKMKKCVHNMCFVVSVQYNVHGHTFGKAVPLLYKMIHFVSCLVVLFR